MLRIKIVFLSVISLFRARYFILRGRLGKVRVPEVHRGPVLAREQFDQAASIVVALTDFTIVKSHHVCFYRAYTLACVFRKLGVPLVLNVGMRNLDGKTSVKGHCWVSLDGKKVFETQDIEQIYPIFLGEASGKVRYWLQTANDSINRIERQRKAI